MGNVLIVVSNVAFGEALSRVCQNFALCGAIFLITDGPSAIGICSVKKPSLMLLDLNLSDIDSFAIASTAAHAVPGIPIVAFSPYCSEYIVYRSEKIRFRGFIDTRKSATAEISCAISQVIADGVYYSDSYRRIRASRAGSSTRFETILSERELEILTLVAVPLSDLEIASALTLSPHTVEKHRFNIIRKLGMNSTTALVRYARILGLVPESILRSADPAALIGWHRTLPKTP